MLSPINVRHHYDIKGQIYLFFNVFKKPFTRSILQKFDNRTVKAPKFRTSSAIVPPIHLFIFSIDSWHNFIYYAFIAAILIAQHICQTRK